MNLKQFEEALAYAADAALSNVSPAGGFAAFLQKNPSVAAIFAVAVLTAHTYLSKLEAQATPAPVTEAPPA